MMRKFFKTYLPASILLAFSTMFLATCGGGGGGGGGSTATLTGLAINGPSAMTEYGTATYAATASWSDNSTSAVTPTWSVDLPTASISPGGVLSCQTIDNDQAATVTATYSSGGVTETATMDVTMTNITTIPFTAPMLSGGIFFEESIPPGGGYSSSLTLLNADLSFEQYSFENISGGLGSTSDYVTGAWGIDASGVLIVDISGQGTVTVMLITDSVTEMEVVVENGTGAPYIVTLEKIVPVDPSLLTGTYLDQNGESWTFNSNSSGSTTGGGGYSFTWSVDSEILKIVFSTGYQGWFYARASSQSTATSYTVLNVAFVELTPTGGFFEYYGGRELTRQ